jgi:uncharacterized protein (DUF924 family)
VAELVHFWFHRLRPRDWFVPDPEVDDALRLRFARELEALRTRPAEEFLAEPRTALAAVLLFDQLPRNLHRGSARAYEFDPLALTIAKGAIGRGWHAGMSAYERQFLGMPLMHSEDIADQQWSLAYYVRLGTRYGWPYAVSHHHVVARFGRFPHRNHVLGRTSTPAEKRIVEQGFAW